MNDRGSALVNILAAVALLMIVGTALMQTVAADAVIARRNHDFSQALQLAEAGIDYGIHMLIHGGDVWPALGEAESSPHQPFVLDLPDGAVTVTVERDIEPDRYVITARAERGNATRQIRATVGHYHSDDPFPYSLFVGGETEEPLHLKNVVIQGPVHINAREVIIEGVEFQDHVHFNSDRVTIDNSTTKWLTALVTVDERTELVLPSNKNHWSHTQIQAVAKDVPFPDIDMEAFSSHQDFYVWDSSVTSVNYADLKEMNYFPGDITLVVDKKDGTPVWPVITVASGGTVTFNVQSQMVHYSAALIVMAEGDIVDVGLLSTAGNTGEVDLYLYAKGRVITEQNVTMSSVMAQVLTIQHNQKQVIRPPDPSIMPQAVREAWKTHGLRIIKWEN